MAPFVAVTVPASHPPPLSRLLSRLVGAGALGLLAAACFLPLVATAAPFVPASDAEVLERLPTRPGDPVQDGLRQLRRRLAAEPDNLRLATDLAGRYFRLATYEGDPRYVGYAQAALAPWWADARPPVPVLVLRAALRQYLHDFDGALADLGQALQREPANLEALSYRAVILIVTARYEEARRDCREIRRLSSDLVAMSCEPTVDGVTGHAEAALAALDEALRRNPQASTGQRLWVMTRQAEIAQRLGRMDDAERHYRAALALGIDDQYLLTARAEFLLDLNRAQEVVALLKDRTRNDVLLLRLALAEKRLGLPAAAEHQAALQARIDAARLRKDKLHLSDEAVFEMTFRGRPGEALRLARENWEAGQREPADARVLMEAALAAGEPAGAAPALDWLRTSRCEDVILKRLADQLRSAK